MTNQDDVAKRLGLKKSEDGFDLDKDSLLQGIGGPLGIAEAILPATLFSIVFGFTQEAVAAVAVAATTSAIFIAIRLGQRKPHASHRRGSGNCLRSISGFAKRRTSCRLLRPGISNKRCLRKCLIAISSYQTPNHGLRGSVSIQ